jgi:hypothetical protein
VKSADTKFGNDHIFDMANFGESSRWMGWSKNEFSHSLGAAANRRYAGQLDDFMKFDCQDCIWESRSAAVAELGR